MAYAGCSKKTGRRYALRSLGYPNNNLLAVEYLIGMFRNISSGYMPILNTNPPKMPASQKIQPWKAFTNLQEDKSPDMSTRNVNTKEPCCSMGASISKPLEVNKDNTNPSKIQVITA
jgi:hypothetical protein